MQGIKFAKIRKLMSWGYAEALSVFGVTGGNWVLHFDWRSKVFRCDSTYGLQYLSFTGRFWGWILTSLAGQPVASKGSGLWTRVSGTQSRGLRYRLSSTVRWMKGTQAFTQSFRASLPWTQDRWTWALPECPTRPQRPEQWRRVIRLRAKREIIVRQVRRTCKGGFLDSPLKGQKRPLWS